MRRLALLMLAAVALDAQAQFAAPESSKAQWTLRKMFVQNGAFGLAPYAADPFTCNAATERATYYNTATHANMFCNGTAWGSLGGSSSTTYTVTDTGATTSVTPTAGDSGTMYYSSVGNLTVDLNTAMLTAGVQIGLINGNAGSVTATGTITWAGTTCSSVVGGNATRLPETQEIWFASGIGLGAATVQSLSGDWYCVPQSANGDERIREVGKGSYIFEHHWTNAEIVGLGAATAGDVPLFGLPGTGGASQRLRYLLAMIVVDGQAAGTTTLTAAAGRVGATYLDWVAAGSIKAAGGTIYGDTLAEQGAGLQNVVGDVRYQTTVDANLHFVSTGANLDQVTGSSGTLYVWYNLEP